MDDDTRLEELRTFLRRQPCGSFSSADDLSHAVAIDLGPWLNGVRRDLRLALELLEVPPACVGAVRPSTLPRVKLVRAAVAGNTVSDKRLARLVEGPRMKASKKALEEHVARTKAHLSRLRIALRRAKRDVRQRRILSTENPPTSREPYEAARRDSYQLITQIARLRSHREIEQRHLEEQLRVAWDEDIASLLADMRDHGLQCLGNANTRSQGFLALLAASAVCSFLNSRLTHTVPAAVRIEQLRASIAERADQLARHSHYEISRDHLALLVPLRDGMAQGSVLVAQARTTLDLLPVEALGVSTTEAQQLVTRKKPALVAFSHLVDPAEIESARAAVVAAIAEIRSLDAAIRHFLEASAPLQSRIKVAQLRVKSLLTKLRKLADVSRPWLAECQLAWRLLVHANDSEILGSETKELSRCLRSETARRLSAPIEEFIKQCAATNFGTREAERMRRCHTATVLMERVRVLEARLGQLGRVLSRFEQAQKRLARLEHRQATHFRRQFRLMTWLSPLPVVGVASALLVKSLITRFENALCSTHPAYAGLIRWSTRQLASATVLSAIGLLLVTAVLSQNPGLMALLDEATGKTWTISAAGQLGLLISYVLSVPMWALLTMRLLINARRRPQICSRA